MARFSYEESEFYGAPKSNYFSLKDDGDTARVRFLINDLRDLMGVSVHEVQVGDRRIDVECLRAYNEPVEKCPLCAANYPTNAKLFIPVYDEGSKESKIWTRGRTFFNKMSSLCARYNPLVSTIFEVERIGKKGDTSTTYETYAQGTDNARIEDFPEIKADEVAFQVKNIDEMNYYLDTGSFPENNQNRARTNEQPQRTSRQNTTYTRQQRETPATPVRRRPTYSEEDNF